MEYQLIQTGLLSSLVCLCGLLVAVIVLLHLENQKIRKECQAHRDLIAHLCKKNKPFHTEI